MSAAAVFAPIASLTRSFAPRSTRTSRSSTLTRATMGAGNSKVPAGMKLTYFDLPALGEPVRLLLELSGSAWEDERITFPEWGALKASTKWGQVPVLKTPDGEEMTQTKALVRYLGAKVPVGGKYRSILPSAIDYSFEFRRVWNTCMA